MSRNSVLILLICIALFGAWRHFRGDTQQALQSSTDALPLDASSSGTVVVYGRDSCAHTQNTLASLRSNNVPVTYVNIDYASANDAFHEKFDGTGLSGDRGYALPVVEVAGRASMRPDPEMVAKQFMSAQ